MTFFVQRTSKNFAVSLALKIITYQHGHLRQSLRACVGCANLYMVQCESVYRLSNATSYNFNLQIDNNENSFILS